MRNIPLIEINLRERETAMSSSPRLIPLNLMLSYPVQWTKQQIIRDIIQNFYDEAGSNMFGKKFKYAFKPAGSAGPHGEKTGQMTLSMAGSGFSYEWLVHLGASTKQEDSGRYAGFYGEGFKIAALTALRDYNWTIRVNSRDWSLLVVASDIAIDGKTLKQLAFKIDKTDYNTETILSIEGYEEDDVPLFYETLQTFFFPENPLIGKLIYSNKYIAIHERSKNTKPMQYPKSYDCRGEGIVFLMYQARGSFFHPLVLCHHRFKTNDRERRDISRGTIQDVLFDMIDCMDEETAYILLEIFNKYWYDYPGNRDDVDSWYSVVRKLVKKITWNYDLTSKFRASHPNLVCCEKPSNLEMRNRKTQALVWYKKNCPEYMLVQDSFLLMGYENIVDMCEEAGGFNITRPPNAEELKLLSFLNSAAKKILNGFILHYPPCNIIDNDTAVYMGTAKIMKNDKIEFNVKGYRIHRKHIAIEIKKRLLVPGGFTEAFATYCHELAHCFGSDASMSFSRALTDIIALVSQNRKVLAETEEQWEYHFNNS
jgi:hypothetical protein